MIYSMWGGYIDPKRDAYNENVSLSKISIENWTTKGNEAKAQQARERLVKYEAEKRKLTENNRA